MYLATIIIDFILKYLKQNKKKVRKMDEMIVKKKGVEIQWNPI